MELKHTSSYKLEEIDNLLIVPYGIETNMQSESNLHG